MPQHPSRSRWFARLVPMLLMVLTLALFLPALTVSDWPDRGQLGIAAWVMLALAAAVRFPMPASTADSTTVMMLDTCVILAGALLLDPAIVMVAVMAGALLGELSRRRPGQRILPNSAQMALQAGVAALVVMAANQLAPDAARLSLAGIVTVVAAGLAMHVVNTLAIAGLIVGDEDVSFLSTWLPMLHGFDVGQRLSHVGQWVLGVIAVVLVDAHPLGFVLLLVPMAALYTSQVRYNQLLRQVQKTLQGAEASLNAAQRIARLGSWEWEVAHDTWHWSDELYRIFGFTPRDFSATRARYLAAVHADDRARVASALELVRQTGVAETLDYRITQQDGTERVVHVRVEALPSTTGQIQTVAGTVLDVTERKQLETRLSHQAYHDPLTGLSNRAHFLERLDSNQRQERIAVLFIDLDNFKEVNDRLGHNAGDRVLCIIAERLRLCLREGDLAARLGGDEFTVLLHGLTTPDSADAVVRRILHVLSEPIAIDDESVLITPSIGVAISEADCDDSSEGLLRDADIAMYRAKRDGKARYAVIGRDAAGDAAAIRLAKAS